MSAPSSSGRWSAGDANVLSTTSSGGARRLRGPSRIVAATPAMSATLSSGLDGVSSQTRRVALVSASQSGSGPEARSTYFASAARPSGGPARSSGTCRRRRRRRRPSPRRRRQLRDGRGRRRARRVRDPVAPALELGDGPLEPLPGRVLRPRILVPAARPPDAVLGERGGLVDRRRDGPRQLVRLRPGVDRQGLEGVARPRAGRDLRRAWADHRIDVPRNQVRDAPAIRHCPMPARASPRDRAVMPGADRDPPEIRTMRHAAASAVSLDLARDRAERDRRAADAWRRVHAQADAERDRIRRAPSRDCRPIPVAGSRAAVAGWLAGLVVRASKPAG